MGKVLAVIGVLALIIIGYYMFDGKRGNPAAETVGNAVEDAADNVEDTVEDVADDIDDATEDANDGDPNP